MFKFIVVHGDIATYGNAGTIVSKDEVTKFYLVVRAIEVSHVVVTRSSQIYASFDESIDHYCRGVLFFRCCFINPRPPSPATST